MMGIKNQSQCHEIVNEGNPASCCLACIETCRPCSTNAGSIFAHPDHEVCQELTFCTLYECNVKMTMPSNMTAGLARHKAQVQTYQERMQHCSDGKPA